MSVGSMCPTLTPAAITGLHAPYQPRHQGGDPGHDGPRTESSASMSIPGAAVRCPHQKGPTHEETDMSFQAYLDTIETKTGKTPRTLVEEANAKGLGGPDAKAGPVVAWLKEE